MLSYNVAALLKSESGAQRTFDVEVDISGIDPDLVLTKPLTGRIRLLRTDSGILATGRLQTEACVPCRRCLESMTVGVEIELEEEFRPSIDILTGAAIAPADGEDEVTRIDGHHILDLTEVVRQSLLLATPATPLCRPDCRGLCPTCGANLNQEPCSCQREEEDPRLAVLRDLL
jgi:uncharacterized protein